MAPTIPPAYAHTDRAWFHSCGYLNAGEHDPWSAVCGQCFRNAPLDEVECVGIVHKTDTVLSAPADPMLYPERVRIRSAAYRATRVYPGPVGETLSIELLAWEEFGYRLGGGRRMMNLITHIEGKAIPKAKEE